MNTHIKVWRFYETPKEYLDVITDHDDADWVAFVPDALCKEWIPWLEHSFGCCKVKTYKVKGGELRVGHHA